MSELPRDLHDYQITGRATLSGGEARIHGTITVDLGAELILEDARLRFAPTGGIVCHGRLIARQTVFTASQTEEGRYGIQLVGAGTAESVLTGCLFEHGRGQALPMATNRQEVYGGGLQIKDPGSATIHVTECHFRTCQADFGGGLAIVGSFAPISEPPENHPPELKACIFEHCSARVAGGGIAMLARMSATVRGCRFSETSAPTGGGIYAYDWCKLSLIDATMSSVQAIEYGGALSIRFSILEINSCSITKASATGGDSQGGALYLEKSSSNVSKASLSDCRARAGGGIFLRGGRLELMSSAILACHADEAGGGLMLTSDAHTAINDCRFANCTIPHDGISGPAANVMESEAIFKRTFFKRFKTTNLDLLVSRSEDALVTFDLCAATLDDEPVKTTSARTTAPSMRRYGYGHPGVLVFPLLWGPLSLLLAWMELQKPGLFKWHSVLTTLAIAVLPWLYDRMRVLAIDEEGIHDHSPLQKVDIPWPDIRAVRMTEHQEEGEAFRNVRRYELEFDLTDGSMVQVIRCDSRASAGQMPGVFLSIREYLDHLRSQRK